jgi:ubiquinone/menaquinone biosynthesis C-methylase UbiE
MKTNYFILIIFLFNGIIFCLPVIGEDQDSLTLPYELRLNKRQPPETVLKTIGIKSGMIIGEVGAGRGRYTVHIASRIGPSGILYANDINQEALNFLKNRCEENNFTNVKTVLGSVGDSKLPTGTLDMVIMVNVVHCLAKPVELLRNVSNALKPEAFIVIVEGNKDKEPSAEAWFTREKLLKIYKEAGYTLFREETFLPKDNIYFLKRNNQIDGKTVPKEREIEKSSFK